MRGIYNRRICIYRLRLQRSLFYSRYRLGKVIDCGKRETGRGICPDRRKREMECLSSVSYPGFRRPDRSVYRLPPDRSRLPAMERNGNLSTRIILFRSETFLDNKQTNNNCMNCHSFCMQDPDKMLFHVRAKYGCTVFVDGDRIETLDTKTDRTISALVYPSWHPSGKFVAFSINNTTQDTHPVHRTEVYDKASDVVVYDVEKQEIITTQALFSKKRFETFPTFSPDGKQLYFCSAPALKVPGELRDLRYSLCRVSFDPESRTFGSVVDTIFQAETEGQSILFPRVSPDGKYLLCTTTSYGTFPIWHKDADLCMFDLSTGAQVPTEEANSPDTDSYHSWSSNSKWVVFSSRRLDGLYTRPFIAHVGERGVLSKPFVLPQKSTEYYTFLTKSYNIPEFVKGKVKTDTYKLVSRIKEGKNQQISFTK